MQAAIDGIREAIKTGIHPSLAPLAARAFRARAERSTDLESALQLAYTFTYFGIHLRPAQVRSEIAAFMTNMAPQNPRVILEIGTANGGSLFMFTRVAAPDALLISVDLPGGLYGGGYVEWRTPLYKAFAQKGQRMELLRADSHDPRTLHYVSAMLDGRAVDLLFIDGDHSYDGVKLDFEMYSPIVRPGGVIAFHDIVSGPESNVGGVPKFWEELKTKLRTTEIVADWRQGGYGIGYVIVGR